MFLKNSIKKPVFPAVDRSLDARRRDATRLASPRLPGFASHRGGSALLLTLMMVSLLLVLVLSFVVQIRFELRGVVNQQHRRRARSDARLGMNLAVAELQKAAGPDQRITGTAALAGHAVHPHWTGVWKSFGNDAPTWLVSGNRDPGQALPPENSVALVPEDADTGTPAVQIPLVSAGPRINLAWWVGDEGVKARIDVAQSLEETNTRPLVERAARARSPLEPDLISLGPPWDMDPNRIWFARNDETARGRMVSRRTLDLGVENVPDSVLFHELTVFGYGLPVNVKDGGMKADWSVVLDSSMENSPLVEHNLGAVPVKKDFNPPVFDFPDGGVSNPDRFFLSDRIGTSVAPGRPRAGPNLGILWNYGKLWRGIQNSTMEITPPRPGVRSNLREADRLPYRNLRESPWRADIQHTNSPIAPVLSHLQFSFRLRSRPEIDPQGRTGYVLQLEMKPVIGFWNPYNVRIHAGNYNIETMIPPMIRVKIENPSGEMEEITSWLRLNWGRGTVDTILPTPGDPQGGLWFGMETPDVDFEPGEVRMFSLDQTTFVPNNIDSVETLELVPRWKSEGAVVVDLRIPVSTGSTVTKDAWVPAGSSVWFDDVYLQDTHHPDTQDQFPNLNPNGSLMWLTMKQGGSFLTRYVDMWNGGNITREADDNDVTMPARVIGSIANKDPVLVDNLVSGNHHVATWAFHLRTTTQILDGNARQRVRGAIDGSPRTLTGNARWDGVREDFATSLNDMEGLNAYASWIGTAFGDSASLADGTGGNRGLVGVGGAGTQSPPTEPTTADTRWRGFLGPSNTAATGFTNVALFDVPRSPLVSVGQFQHAQLSRYNFEPDFTFGNSYASFRIPTDRTVAEDFADFEDFDLYDISYEVNQRLWDGIFFSTLAPDYVAGADDFDEALDLSPNGLPNPRMVHVPLEGDTFLDDLIGNAGPNGVRGAEALASRIRVRGAFNVNSTSITAWKAVLASMVSTEMPVVNPENGVLSWETPEGIRFPRFGHVLNREAYESGDPNEAAFWQGWRKLSADDLDTLATAIVDEVKARGPFRSMSAFVNRDPDSPEKAHQRKGALQAALDRTVNALGGGIADGLGEEARNPRGGQFSDAVDGESNTAGHAAFLLQGDVLQNLAPILQARSDTFLIRAYGEQVEPNGGTPISRAWCEAVVQRRPEYVEQEDEPWRNPVDDTLHPVNERFGRRFEIVAFRWLDASEIPEGN